MKNQINVTPFSYLNYYTEMVNDLSKKILNKYFKLIDKRVNILLKNNQSISGKIGGYFYGSNYYSDPYIEKWHILEEDNTSGSAEDSFGYLNGIIIFQKDIAEICFLEDGTKLK